MNEEKYHYQFEVQTFDISFVDALTFRYQRKKGSQDVLLEPSSDQSLKLVKSTVVIIHEMDDLVVRLHKTCILSITESASQ